MGLSDLYPFDANKKIIEYQFQEAGELVDKKINAFTELLSTDSPAPGGGSVAALCGALSGALSSMVAALTHAKKDTKRIRKNGRDRIGSAKVEK